VKSAVLALFAAICWGAAPLIERKALVLPASPILAVAGRSVFVFGAMCLMAFFARGALISDGFGAKEARLWLLCVAAGGILSGGIGQWFYFSALRGESAPFVVAICGTYPLFTLVAGLATHQERFVWSQALGTALIVAGAALLLLSRSSGR